MATAGCTVPIEMFSSRYPFGRHRQQSPTERFELPRQSQCVLLKRQYHPSDRQELLTKIKYHSQLRHGNLIGILRSSDEAENCLLAVEFEYVPSSLRDVFGMLSEEELEHGRNSMYQLCSYLISNNINPQVAEELIGVDGFNQLKLFLDVDFRVLNPQQNRTDLIRAKRAEINLIIDRHIASCNHGGICRTGASCIRSQVIPNDTNYWLLGTQGVSRTCQLNTMNTTFGCGGASPIKGISVVDSMKIRPTANIPNTPGLHKSQSQKPREAVAESSMNTRTLSGIINNYMQLSDNSVKSQNAPNYKKKLSTFAKYDRKKLSGESRGSRQSSNNNNGRNILPMNSRVSARQSDASAYNTYELPMCSQMASEDQQGRRDEVLEVSQTKEEEDVVYTISVEQCDVTRGESDDTYKVEFNQGTPVTLQVPRVSMRKTADASFYHSPRPTEVEKNLNVRASVVAPSNPQSRLQKPELPFSKQPPESKKSPRQPAVIAYTPARTNAIMASDYRRSCQINERVRQSLRKTQEAVARYSQFRRV